jgi:predicted Zn-dependent peptidase
MTGKRAIILIASIPLLLALLSSNSNSAEEIFSETLDNGMRITLVENRATPLVSATIFVKVGSAYENEHSNGLSHLLEHLVFNGTRTRSQEQIYAQQARLGVFEHASTSKEWTTFTFVFPKENLKPSLDLLSDMLFNSVIPEEKLAKEKGIVIEELSRAQASPRQRESQLVEQVFFRDTAYALTVLGTEPTIQNLSREQIVQFYRRYYRPANMVGLFIGDFSPADMSKLVRRFFGSDKIDKSVASSPGPPRIITPRNEQRSGSISQLSLAFPGPGVKSPDLMAFKLLASVLSGQGALSLEARLKTSFPADIINMASYVELFRGFSRLTIRLTLTEESPASAILDILRGELFDFARQGASYVELQGAKNSLLTPCPRISRR